MGLSRPATALFAVGGLAAMLTVLGIPTVAADGVWNANPATSNQGYAISNGSRAAQSFAPLQPFVLYNVTLRVQNQGGSSDDLTVTIETDAGGAPSGTVLARANARSSGVGWLDFPLVPRPALGARMTYWIVASSTQPAGQGYQWFHADADTVAGRAEQDLGSGWSVTANTDLTYVTYGVGLESRPLYLAFDGTAGWEDELRAAAPTGTLADFDNDGIPGLTLNAGLNASWVLSPALAAPFHFWGPVSLTVFMDSRWRGEVVTLNVTLYDVGATITPMAFTSRTVTFNNFTDYEAFEFDLGTLDHRTTRGNVTRLEVVETAGREIYLAYNAAAVPSAIVATTDTGIHVDAVLVRDGRGPSTVFSTREAVTVVANVSHPFGSAEIAGGWISLDDPAGNPLETNASMTQAAVDARVPSEWKVFAYTYGPPSAQGSYAFVITSVDGTGARADANGSFVVRVPVFSLAVFPSALAVASLDPLTFAVFLNNTGQGVGMAWLNVTLPTGLGYVSDTVAAIGGARTGTANWTVWNLGPGSYRFNITARVASGVAQGTDLAFRFDLAYADEKGFPWPAPGISGEVLVSGAASIPGLDGPLMSLVLLGLAIAAPPIGYGVWRRRRSAIEEVFLVHEHGVLLCHLSRRMRAQGDKDDDVLGAMLTVVQDFVRDSFRYGKDRDLDKVEFGSYRVLIERGDYVYLAAAFSGRDSPEIRRRLRRTIAEVEASFGTDLAEFDGIIEPILGVRDIVGRLIHRG